MKKTTNLFETFATFQLGNGETENIKGGKGDWNTTHGIGVGAGDPPPFGQNLP